MTGSDWAARVIAWRRGLWLLAGLLSVAAVIGLSRLEMGVAYQASLPDDHPYIQVSGRHAQAFGSGNRLVIAVVDGQGDIWSPRFLGVLERITNRVFLLPGIDRARVTSLFTPNVRYTRIVPDGFSGGPVVPRDFKPTAQMAAQVRANVAASAQARQLVSARGDAALIQAMLTEVDPASGERLDYLAVVAQLERELRAAHAGSDISIHVIGFAPFIAELAAALERSWPLFVVTLLASLAILLLALRRWHLALLPLGCSLLAVLWLLGGLGLAGLPLHPFAVLVPFLVFAIGVSHGVQLVRAWQQTAGEGVGAQAAAIRVLAGLGAAGLLALASDAAGFLTILWIDIPMVRDLALMASVGVALLLFTNLLLLPGLLVGLAHRATPERIGFTRLRGTLVEVVDRPLAVALACAIIAVPAAYLAAKVPVGHQQAGVPELHVDSHYNRDLALIRARFDVGADELVVFASAGPDGCVDFPRMAALQDLVARLKASRSVRSVQALTEAAVLNNIGWHEGNLKWATLPRLPAALGETVAPVDTTSGLLNHDCSVMPIAIQLDDHRSETIARVLAIVEAARVALPDGLALELAGGNVGAQAAVNAVVADAQLPILLTIYGAVLVICALGFRSVWAAVAIVLPLALGTLLVYALMAMLDISLTLASLPVIALGAGIGVDYGMYIYSYLRARQAAGESLHAAHDHALHLAGGAVLATALALVAGVLPWTLSELRYQADMGLLLSAMFVLNMLAAVTLLPALVALRSPRR